MPQYLEIRVGGDSAAVMRTSHRQGTRYDVSWCTGSGFHREFCNIDTGVECQPKKQPQRRRDFQNDFAHMRRAIAAASKTGKRFLDELEKVDRIAPSELERVEMRLRTNCYDRGTITIDPTEPGKADMRIEVRAGPARPENPQPTQVKNHIREDIDISGTHALAMAIEVLDSQGRWILELLSRGI